MLLRRRKDIFIYFSGFSGAGEVYLNTSPAPKKYFYIYTCTYLIPLQRRRSLGSIKKHLSGAGELVIYTFPAPEKYLYTLIWRGKSRRSIYIHPLICGGYYFTV